MNITVQSYIGITVVVEQGVLNDSTFTEIDAKLSRIPRNRTKQVWLDCTHLQHIKLTQTCFSSFINRLLKLHREDVQVVLFGISNSTRYILSLLHLDKLFQQVTTLEDAYLLIKQQYTAAKAEAMA